MLRGVAKTVLIAIFGLVVVFAKVVAHGGDDLVRATRHFLGDLFGVVGKPRVKLSHELPTVGSGVVDRLTGRLSHAVPLHLTEISASEWATFRAGPLFSKTLFVQRRQGGFQLFERGIPQTLSNEQLIVMLRQLPPECQIVGDGSDEFVAAMRASGRVLYRDIRDFTAHPNRSATRLRPILVASGDLQLNKQLFPGQSPASVARNVETFRRLFSDRRGRVVETLEQLSASIDELLDAGETPLVIHDNHEAGGVVLAGGTVYRYDRLSHNGRVMPLACNLRDPGSPAATADILYLDSVIHALDDSLRDQSPELVDVTLARWHDAYQKRVHQDGTRAQIRFVLTVGPAGVVGVTGAVYVTRRSDRPPPQPSPQRRR
jgi:hypothetical protein